MAFIAPKNWESFQHYKDRSPPWIKLHKKLLDDYEFQCLPVASRALAPMLWLIASEHENGWIDAAPEKLAFRLRISGKEVESALTPLIERAFFEVVHDASATVADRKRDAMPEKRREETETEKKRACATRLPEGFAVSDRVLKWATARGLQGVIELHLEAFISTCRAKGYTYVDWDEAFMNAVRKNWARIEAPKRRADGGLKVVV